MRALISVYDKTGLAPFAQGLVDLGYELVASGGTADALEEAGLSVTQVEDVTGFPEMLGGRVKTLHPRIHAGILARRELPEDLAVLEEHGIEPFDLVCVNLYPFELAVDRPELDEAGLIEMIDIGGPALVRAAAKSFASVAVVARSQDYDRVLERAAGRRRNADDGAASTPCGDRVRAHRRVRSRDRAVVPARRSAPADARSGLRTDARPLVRREPPPARRVLHGARRPDTSAVVRRPAPGQAALVQQPERPLGGAPARVRARRAGVRDRQARESLRCRRRRHDRGCVREARSPQIPSRRTGEWSC